MNNGGEYKTESEFYTKKIILNNINDLMNIPIQQLRTAQLKNFYGSLFDQLYQEAMAIEHNQEIKIENGKSILDLIVELGFTASKGEAKRLIQGGGVKIDGEKIADMNYTISFDNSGQKINVLYNNSSHKNIGSILDLEEKINDEINQHLKINLFNKLLLMELK